MVSTHAAPPDPEPVRQPLWRLLLLPTPAPPALLGCCERRAFPFLSRPRATNPLAPTHADCPEPIISKLNGHEGFNALPDAEQLQASGTGGWGDGLARGLGIALLAQRQRGRGGAQCSLLPAGSSPNPSNLA